MELELELSSLSSHSFPKFTFLFFFKAICVYSSSIRTILNNYDVGKTKKVSVVTFSTIRERVEKIKKNIVETTLNWSAINSLLFILSSCALHLLAEIKFFL